MTQNRKTAPFFLGEINGHRIVVVVSDGNCFEDVPDEMKSGCLHLIANPEQEMTRDQAYHAGIRPGAIADMLRDVTGAIRSDLIKHFFPGMVGQNFGARTEVNDLVTAKMNTVHIHFVIALAEYWQKGWFRRCVDSILSPRRLVTDIIVKLRFMTEDLSNALDEFFAPKKPKA